MTLLVLTAFLISLACAGLSVCRCCPIPYCGCPGMPRRLYVTVEGCTAPPCSDGDGSFYIDWNDGSDPSNPCNLEDGWGNDDPLGGNVCWGATCFQCTPGVPGSFDLNTVDGTVCGFLSSPMTAVAVDCDPFLWTITVPAAGNDDPPDCDCTVAGVEARCCNPGDLITITISELPP